MKDMARLLAVAIVNAAAQAIWGLLTLCLHVGDAWFRGWGDGVIVGLAISYWAAASYRNGGRS